MLSKGFISIDSIISNKYTIFFFFFVYSLILLFFYSGFSPLYSFNFWSDINVYYTIGKGIFFGKVPYADLFDHKGPIIFFIYSIGYIMSPNSFLGMYVLQTFFLSISLICIYLISNFFLVRYISLFVSSFFPFFFFFFSFIGGSAEEFILPLMFISLYFFIKYFHSNKPIHRPLIMFLHGILIGAVFLIKANLIIFWFFPICIVLYFQLRYKTTFFFKNLLSLISGFFLVFFSISFYFIYNNAFVEFINAYFILNIKYSSIPYTGIKNYVLGLLYNAFVFFSLNKISFLLSLFGVMYFTFSNVLTKNKMIRTSIILTFLSTLFILLTAPIIMQYYYIISCVFIPLGIISVCKLLSNYEIFRMKYLYYSLCFCSFLLIVYTWNFSISPFNYKGGDIFDQDKIVVNTLADKITESDDRSLMCIGLDLGVDVFTKSHTLPTINYFFTPNVVIGKAQHIYDTQKKYIKNQEVNFIIVREGYRNMFFFEEALNEFYVPIFDSNKYILFKKKR